jgi:hypothetical protein
LLITRMGLESNGSHTVQWPPLLIWKRLLCIYDCTLKTYISIISCF